MGAADSRSAARRAQECSAKGADVCLSTGGVLAASVMRNKLFLSLLGLVLKALLLSRIPRILKGAEELKACLSFLKKKRFRN